MRCDIGTIKVATGQCLELNSQSADHELLVNTLLISCSSGCPHEEEVLIVVQKNTSRSKLGFGYGIIERRLDYILVRAGDC